MESDVKTGVVKANASPICENCAYDGVCKHYRLVNIPCRLVGESDLQSLLGNMSQQQLMQLLGGMGGMGGMASLLGGRPGSSGSDTAP